MKSVMIGDKVVSDYTVPFVIAEIGANFNGDLEIAKKMILEAKNAGVDAVKFQCWTKDNIVVQSAWKDKEASMKSFGHSREDELLDFLSLSDDGHREMAKYCKEIDIMFSSTPVSFENVELCKPLQSINK